MVLRNFITVFVKSPDLWQIEKGRVLCILKQNICLCNCNAIIMTVNCFLWVVL